MLVCLTVDSEVYTHLSLASFARIQPPSRARPPTRSPAPLLARTRLVTYLPTSALDSRLAYPVAHSAARPPNRSPARSPGHTLAHSLASTLALHTFLKTMMLIYSSGAHRRHHPRGAGYSGAAASDLGQVPVGLELANAAAASACGLIRVIRVLEGITAHEFPGF